MAGLGSSTTWRHVVVGAVVVAGPVLALAGCLGRPYEPEGFDAKQIVVTPEGTDGVRIRETVDQDFGTFGKHGYERSIPNDFGVPVDVEASSPDAPADVSVVPDPARSGHTRIRIGDPDETVTGQHRYVLTYTLPAAQLSSGSLFLDIIDPGEPFATEDFEVVVTGLTLDDPQCDRRRDRRHRRLRACRRRRPVPRRARPARHRRGRSISGGIVQRFEAPPVAEPPLPDRREEAAPPARRGDAADRRCRRGTVFAVSGAAAATRSTPGARPTPRSAAPPAAPGSPPLTVTYVADDRMGDLATTEFEPPRGIAPWQGQVLLAERITPTRRVPGSRATRHATCSR